MAEAEDVILQAAEHVTTVARAVWRRHRPPEEPHGAALMDISRRLSLLIQASCGRGWALTPSDPPPKPYWLAERLRQRPPWERARHAEAFTDGVQIFLPRYLHLCGDEAKDRELLRLMALMLAARLARGSVGCCPAQPVARDLFWGMDGTMVEAFCLAEFPGLKAQIAAARRLALATRPSLDVLTPCERAVEQVVQQILEAPPGGVPATLLDPFPGPALPEAVAYWAERLVEQLPFRGAGLYRGMAPVPHWGRPRPDL